ncbi:hypothetical protein QJS10_CPB20g00818 [Acorus calamus]|uniref:Uncharacterized protein n=1 Tax=Acorus calamus TaxID=4465 RepID=A0AAV9C989_ACOCL|nr:hypothetical protein QJS10_CPB20g00818 [Acorus calamus]
MASTCISNSCIIDDAAHRRPVRATYMNLYKWPGSDAEFVKSVNRKAAATTAFGHPAVADSYSCRQMFLRSYTFSKKETVGERTKKCLGKVKEKVVMRTTKTRNSTNCEGKENLKKRRRRKGRCVVVRRVGEVTCAAFQSVFHRLLSCSTTVDVVDRRC